ncbi:MAG: hypothetical protein EA420_19790 [Candidatus Competibacteraceae bacterium]|nr:MAG: hypothetical protein EA420_19790 [Candidatus Competibacteraceae bacterium]
MLGCTAVVQLTDYETGLRGSLCIWGIHGTAAQPLPLTELVQSADEALRNALAQENFRTGQTVKARGLVIRSSLAQQCEFATQPVHLAYGVTHLSHGIEPRPPDNGFPDYRSARMIDARPVAGPVVQPSDPDMPDARDIAPG